MPQQITDTQRLLTSYSCCPTSNKPLPRLLNQPFQLVSPFPSLPHSILFSAKQAESAFQNIYQVTLLCSSNPPMASCLTRGKNRVLQGSSASLPSCLLYCRHTGLPGVYCTNQTVSQLRTSALAFPFVKNFPRWPHDLLLIQVSNEIFLLENVSLTTIQKITTSSLPLEYCISRTT